MECDSVKQISRTTTTPIYITLVVYQDVARFTRALAKVSLLTANLSRCIKWMNECYYELSNKQTSHSSHFNLLACIVGVWSGMLEKKLSFAETLSNVTGQVTNIKEEL